MDIIIGARRGIEGEVKVRNALLGGEEKRKKMRGPLRWVKVQ